MQCFTQVYTGISLHLVTCALFFVLSVVRDIVTSILALLALRFVFVF